MGLEGNYYNGLKSNRQKCMCLQGSLVEYTSGKCIGTISVYIVCINDLP